MHFLILHAEFSDLSVLKGNAGNPLGRFPVFERLFLGTGLSVGSSILDDTAIIAMAPRSFWKSSPRTPTERGIIADYKHALAYATKRFPDASIVLYGHSLGGSIAICLGAVLKSADYPNIKGIILENPFASIPGMVKALYPQRWLPYHYLGKFAFDKWDALSALQNAKPSSLLYRLSTKILVIVSKKDAVVPHEMGISLFNAAAERIRDESCTSELDTARGNLPRLVNIRGALHEDAWKETLWRREVELYVDAVQK